MSESIKATTDRDIAVPDTADFFREMDDDGRLTPVAAAARRSTATSW